MKGGFFFLLSFFALFFFVVFVVVFCLFCCCFVGFCLFCCCFCCLFDLWAFVFFVVVCFISFEITFFDDFLYFWVPLETMNRVPLPLTEG